MIYIMKRVNFYLTDKEINALKIISKETGLSVSELVRRTVDAFIKKHEKNIPIQGDNK